MSAIWKRVRIGLGMVGLCYEVDGKELCRPGNAPLLSVGDEE